MSKTRSVGQASAAEVVMRALTAKPRASAAEVAWAAGVGRSTASKTLARLEGAGEVQRIEGGREGRRRMPDRWMIADAKPAASTGKGRIAKPGGDVERLRPGQLDGLVLAYLKKNASSAPHGPSTIGRALNRSSGAVANCLVRLARAERVREVSERPRRYSLAA